MAFITPFLANYFPLPGFGGAGGRFCALLQKAIPGEMQPQCNGKSEGGTAFRSITPRKSFVFVGNAVPVSRERSGKIEPHWMDVLGEGNPTSQRLRSWDGSSVQCFQRTPLTVEVCHIQPTSLWAHIQQ
ncbi:inosine-uridine nucleoside N-ribohydrolase [Anopheles sinensis]|uniref:Inosine-uridine nucleoside N-ribohydrolase n=1 Tax=Anopheles sinensis TaxID=74873 RepID=A0A084WC40_ANOSI|nr:inosine-uridine nucleoside N-ribohydrolase [Anopheles sinensis]